MVKYGPGRAADPEPVAAACVATRLREERMADVYRSDVDRSDDPSLVDLDIVAGNMRIAWLCEHIGTCWSADDHPPWATSSDLRRAKWRQAAKAAYRMLRSLGFIKESVR